MPIVRVTLIENRTAQQKQAAAKDITEALVKHCGAHADHIYVVFEDVNPDDWVIAGETITERRRQRGET